MITDILSEYQNYLGQKHGDQTLKRFNHLLENNREAAISEEVTLEK